MIADLHCHYAMHLFQNDPDPRGSKASWNERLVGALESEVMKFVAKVASDHDWGSGWRISLDGLEQGGVRIVCSVLYWPAAEFDPSKLHGQPPLGEYYEDIQHQRKSVEEDLERQDPNRERAILAESAADLDDPRIVFVHCVEGGMQLGDEVASIDEKVRELAGQGVVYITLAHLFYRQVATNAPAIPIVSDDRYEKLFPQPAATGLTALGRAAVRAMYQHSVLIDVSHMSERAIAEAFALVETLDEQNGDAPEDYPLIATHVGMRKAVPEPHEYNLSDECAKKIHRRGGLIGLITSRHWMGSTSSEAESQKVVGRHLAAIEDACGDHAASAIGTDLDGFVKPTFEGLDKAGELTRLEAWIRAGVAEPRDAEAILHGNARRVLKKAFERRAEGRVRDVSERTPGGAADGD
ncbi:MAG TPA: membrane dipeptidase [Solirubrobacteraceae bacterium]|nr:membrane dipeptidase [Solirubrobacteraceae bacterium]